MRVGNRTLDEAVLKELKETLIEDEEKYGPDLDRATDLILELETNKRTMDSRSISDVILQNSYQLALYRIVEGEAEWNRFILELSTGRISVRQTDTIRRYINNEMFNTYDKYKESRADQNTVIEVSVWDLVSIVRQADKMIITIRNPE